MTSDASSPARRSGAATDADFYPELEAAGSLAAALESTAAELGLHLGDVLRHDSEPLRVAGVASSLPHRGTSWVGLGSGRRSFTVQADAQGVRLVSSSTADLREVARALDAWRNGAKLREIQRVAPFVKVSELAEAHERGPAEAVTVKWRLLVEEVEREPVNRMTPVILAAYAEPKLRQLYPYTSHGSLHVSTCTGFPFSSEVPYVAPLAWGGYGVFRRRSPYLVGETDTPAGALALVLGEVPADCGPAVAGHR